MTSAHEAATVPEPGIYPGVLADDYHRWPALSSTRLKWMDRSPNYCRWKESSPGKPTPAMQFGTAAHFAVLEPGQFDQRYVSVGPCSANKKDGAACRNTGTIYRDGTWWCGVRGHAPARHPDEPNETRVVLTRDEYQRACAIRDAAHANPLVRDLIDRPDTVVEASIVWMGWGGVLCKGRPDAYNPDGSLGDLKVTIHAHPNKIERFLFNNGTHRQLALYTEGLQELGVPIQRQSIIAIEPEPPHDLCVYRAHPDLIRAGAADVHRLRGMYSDCVASGKWPSYRAPEPIALPEWAMRDLLPEDYAPVALKVGGEEVQV